MEAIGVRFGGGVRPRPCDPCGVNLDVGDRCIVETERGQEFGVVARVALSNPYVGGYGRRLPRVLRRATVDDEEAYTRKAAIEAEGRAFALGRIAERAMPMVLGQVDRQLDGRKMTFYFIADSRIDFRDLVRDLSARFSGRIEMRQIGARDDAGMKGGCGPCGLGLCCSSHLRGFDPVSIKMAKSQGLSLNPAKISGMCGRLMCCLKYEYDPQVSKARRPCAECPNGSPVRESGSEDTELVE